MATINFSGLQYNTTQKFVETPAFPMADKNAVSATVVASNWGSLVGTFEVLLYTCDDNVNWAPLGTMGTFTADAVKILRAGRSAAGPWGSTGAVTQAWAKIRFAPPSGTPTALAMFNVIANTVID